MIENFRQSLRNNTTSYKFTFALAFLQTFKKRREPKIPIEDLGRYMALKYYETNKRYRLREISNPSTPPAIVQLIETYLGDQGMDPNEWVKLDRQQIAQLTACVTTAKGAASPFRYVMACFETAKKLSPGKRAYHYPSEGQNHFFAYNKRGVTLTNAFVKALDTHSIDLYTDLAVLGWARFLETFNSVPALIGKISDEPPKRHLRKFTSLVREIPDFESGTCFLCQKPLARSELSLDHMVPFDYVYSDDLWNLVPAHKTCNSTKNMRVGSEGMLERLTNRNRMLFRRGDSHEKLRRSINTHFRSEQELTDRLRTLYQGALSAGYRVWPNQGGGETP